MNQIDEKRKTFPFIFFSLGHYESTFAHQWQTQMKLGSFHFLL